LVSLHGAPSSAELLEAVREWLERDVMSSTEGRLRFHARVAANVLATVERELGFGAEQDAAHRERLASLGVTDDAELARAIRDGDLDDRLDAVRAAVRADVADRLSVANPKYSE
jgi:hypothetical protein